MKQIYIYVLVALAAATVPVAGAQPVARPSMERQALRGMEMAATLTAQAVYRPDQFLSQVRTETSWENESRTRHEYLDGQLAYRYTDMWDGSDWIEAERHQYAYWEGMLSQDITYEYGEPVNRITYSVANGAYTGYLEDRWEGDWVPVERVTLTTVGSLTIGGTTETWTGTSYVAFERFSVVQSGADVWETYESGFGTGWTFTERYIYPSMTIAELNLWVANLINTIADYGDLLVAARLPDRLELAYDGFDWLYVARQSTETTLNMGGGGYVEQERITTEEWDGSSWQPAARLVLDYDVLAGTQTIPRRAAIQGFDGNDWVDFFVEGYVVDMGIGRIRLATLYLDLGLGGMTDISRVEMTWIGLSTGVDGGETPAVFQLAQNYPNPFNPSTRISYSLETAQNVRLAVYDLLGREVALLESGVRGPGVHRIQFAAQGLPSGLYLYRLEVAGKSQARQMLLVE